MKIEGLYAIESQKYMKTHKKNKSDATEKLTSGYRINKAADDAAGLSISEDMRRQVRGLGRASLNSQEGISALQIADGAMAEVQEMLNRGLELCIQSANGTYSASDRESLQQEVDQIKTEIDQIAERTYYNELEVLKGAGKEEDLEPLLHRGLAYKGQLPGWVYFGGNVKEAGFMTMAYNTTQQYQDSSGNIKTASIPHVAASLDFSQFDGSSAKKAELYDKGFHFTCCTCDRHFSIRFTSGTDSSMEISDQHRIYNVGIDSAANGEQLVRRIIDATGGAVKDSSGIEHFTDLAADDNNKALLWVYDDRSSGYDRPADLGAWLDWRVPAYGNDIDESRGWGRFGEGVAAMGVDEIHLPDPSGGKSIELQAGSETGERVPIKLPYLSSKKLGVAEVNIRTAEGALYGIDIFKNASAYISTERSRCGAYQNRMEHNINNVENTAENVTASESRIRDADMALESMRFSKSNVLERAAQAIMAQANQSYQGVMNLLTI